MSNDFNLAIAHASSCSLDKTEPCVSCEVWLVVGIPRQWYWLTVFLVSWKEEVYCTAIWRAPTLRASGKAVQQWCHHGGSVPPAGASEREARSHPVRSSQLISVPHATGGAKPADLCWLCAWARTDAEHWHGQLKATGATRGGWALRAAVPRGHFDTKEGPCTNRAPRQPWVPLVARAGQSSVWPGRVARGDAVTGSARSWTTLTVDSTWAHARLGVRTCGKSVHGILGSRQRSGNRPTSQIAPRWHTFPFPPHSCRDGVASSASGGVRHGDGCRAHADPHRSPGGTPPQLWWSLCVHHTRTADGDALGRRSPHVRGVPSPLDDPVAVCKAARLPRLGRGRDSTLAGRNG